MELPDDRSRIYGTEDCPNVGARGRAAGGQSSIQDLQSKTMKRNCPIRDIESGGHILIVGKACLSSKYKNRWILKDPNEEYSQLE